MRNTFLTLAVFAVALFLNERAVFARSIAFNEVEQIQPEQEQELVSPDLMSTAGEELDIQGLDSSLVRRVVCYARNRNGVTFDAVGIYAPQVQNAALRRCYEFSGRCVAVGCREVYIRRGD